MKLSDRTPIFRKTLHVSLIVVLTTLGITALSSCTVTYTKRRPAPPPPEVVYVDTDPMPDEFPELDPYGRWVDVRGSGWAWQPAVASNWRPYHHGQWAWTDHGWTWVSYEPFGWAVYHYGNWSMDSRLGWVWFPDYEWQPHRVTWVVYQDYIAWAPTPYTGYVVGDPWAHQYQNVWSVCNVKHFTRRYVGDYRVSGHVINRNNRHIYRHAPNTKYIYRHTGTQVVKIHVKTRPVAGNKKGLRRMELPERERGHIKKHKERAHKEIKVGKNDGRGEPTPMLPPGRNPKIVDSGPNIISQSDDSEDRNAQHPRNKRMKDEPRSERHNPGNQGMKDDPRSDHENRGDQDKKNDGKNPGDQGKKHDPKSDRENRGNQDEKNDSKKDNGKKDEPKSKKDDDKSKKDDDKSKKDDDKSKKDGDKSKKEDPKSKKDDNKSKKEDPKSKKDEKSNKKNDKGSNDKDDDSESDSDEEEDDSKDKKGEGKGQK